MPDKLMEALNKQWEIDCYKKLLRERAEILKKKNAKKLQKDDQNTKLEKLGVNK